MKNNLLQYIKKQFKERFLELLFLQVSYLVLKLIMPDTRCKDQGRILYRPSSQAG